MNNKVVFIEKSSLMGNSRGKKSLLIPISLKSFPLAFFVLVQYRTILPFSTSPTFLLFLVVLNLNYFPDITFSRLRVVSNSGKLLF